MIGVDKFYEIIEIYKEHEYQLDKLTEIFPVAFESKLVDCFWKCHNELISAYFDKIGFDLITDFLCDILYNAEDEKITDIDDLWNIVKEYRK